MCKELCGHSSEPGNPQEAKWWRWRVYQNHGYWPTTAKQEKEGKTPRRRKPKPKPTELPKITYAPVKRDKHGGELPEQEQNDNGFGYHMVYPQVKCPHCPAAFHSPYSLPNHIKERHPEQDGGDEGTAGVPAK